MKFPAIIASLLMVPVLAAASGGETPRFGFPRPPAPAGVPTPVTDLSSGEGEFSAVIFPEASVPTEVFLSSSDVNRFVCSAGDIKDVVFSKEKGVSAKVVGRDVYVKFVVTRLGDKKVYSATPTEMYIVCGGATYSMIANPKRIPSQIIRLSSGKDKKVQENVSGYDGLPFEKKIMKLIREAYTENLPESYTILEVNQRLDLFKEISVVMRRVVEVEGAGFTLKEYRLSLSSTYSGDSLRLHEKLFLKPNLTTSPVGVSLEDLVLRRGMSTRLFVVEKRQVGPDALSLPSSGGEPSNGIATTSDNNPADDEEISSGNDEPLVSSEDSPIGGSKP